MKILPAVCGAMLVSGCASSPAPNFFNGGYYMVGDASCQRMQAVSSTEVMCYDKKGQQTGYRTAMTSQDMQFYQTAMNRQQAEYQQIMQSLKQTDQTFQNMGQQFAKQGQQFSVPPVQPTSPYGYSGGVTYTQAGNSLIGSNGVTYRQVGSSIMGSDGTRCQIVGPNIICQ
jgi:hypothetical protein